MCNNYPISIPCLFQKAKPGPDMSGHFNIHIYRHRSIEWDGFFQSRIKMADKKYLVSSSHESIFIEIISKENVFTHRPLNIGLIFGGRWVNASSPQWEVHRRSMFKIHVWDVGHAPGTRLDPPDESGDNVNKQTRRETPSPNKTQSINRPPVSVAGRWSPWLPIRARSHQRHGWSGKFAIRQAQTLEAISPLSFLPAIQVAHLCNSASPTHEVPEVVNVQVTIVYQPENALSYLNGFNGSSRWINIQC